MSREFAIRLGRRTLGRRAVTLASAAVGLLLIAGGGSLLGAQSAAVEPPRVSSAGPTTSVCTVATASDSRTDVAAVSIGPDQPRPGRLTAESVQGKKTSLNIADLGKGRTLQQRTSSVVLQAEGSMATASTGVVLGTATSGAEAGLMAAPCLAPSTTHWFVGIGADKAERTELLVTNPDEAQAEIDLRFYGRRGRVVVPGSPGITIPGRTSRTVSLSSLLQTQGPLSLAIRASSGRVTAVAEELRTDRQAPDGADYQLASAPPSKTVVIPSLPDGDGARRLVVTNPGSVRASVTVDVLGLQGAYAPVGAEAVDLAPESSAELDLTTGLAGEFGAIRLSSDQPVTGAVISSSRRSGAQGDIAIQSAAVPLVGAGVSAIATTDLADTDLVISNGTDADTQLSFEVLSYEGVLLRHDDVFLSGNSTATRRLNSPAPSYLVVRVPAGSGVYGGVVLAQPEGSVAGLATSPLTSPDVASRAPDVVLDTNVGR
jgi:hypothetical protein